MGEWEVFMRGARGGAGSLLNALFSQAVLLPACTDTQFSHGLSAPSALKAASLMFSLGTD